MNISYYKKSKFGFDETLSNLKTNLEKEGIKVSSEINLESQLGTILNINDKKVLQKIMEIDHNLVGLIPDNIAVLNKNNAVLVGTINPELMAGVTPNHDIQHLSEDVSEKMKSIVNAATGAENQKVSNVKLYSTHTCPYCKNEKDWLEKNMIKHENIYLEDSPKEAEYVVRSTGQMGVPVTEIVYDDGESEFVIGFDRNKLEKILIK